MERKVLVVGASGLVGSAVLRHFASVDGCEVIGISRRRPENLGTEAGRISHVPLDIQDQGACAAALSEMADVTDLVYTAVHEERDVVAGWSSQDQMQTNRKMLTNIFEPLEDAAP